MSDKFGHLHRENFTALEKPAILVFVPGMWGAPDQFGNWMEYAGQWGWESYAIRHRVRRGADLMELVSDVSGLVREIREKGNRVVLIGHSRGGLLAQHVATRIPVDAMVLVSSAEGGITGLSWPLISRVLRRPHAYLTPMFLDRNFKPSLADAQEILFNGLYRNEVVEAHRKLVPDSGRAAWQILWGGKAPRIKTLPPTLVISGQFDRVIPPRVSRRLAKRYGAEAVQVRAAHYPMLEGNESAGWGKTMGLILKHLDKMLAS